MSEDVREYLRLGRLERGEGHDPDRVFEMVRLTQDMTQEELDRITDEFCKWRMELSKVRWSA